VRRKNIPELKRNDWWQRNIVFVWQCGRCLSVPCLWTSRAWRSVLGKHLTQRLRTWKLGENFVTKSLINCILPQTLLTLILLMWRIRWAPNSIFQYTRISNKIQGYTVYLYLETTLHVSGGTSTHHQERIQLYLQQLVFVTLLLLSVAIVEDLEPVWVCCGWRTPPTAHSNQFQLFHNSGR
jgi:hypothetical protein